MFYSLIIALVIFALFGLILFYKNAILKNQLSFLESDLESLQTEQRIFEEQKIEHIKKIERLENKLESQNYVISEFEKLRKDSEAATKAALFDLGNDLSRQLIEMTKKENQESRELSEKNIKSNSEKFNNEFERLVGMIGSLSKEIAQSKDTVDIIKNSLLSPSGAGHLAEITLENILKASGLLSGTDYLMQYIVDNQLKAKLRPDAVIFLPSNNIMVIDAKASKFLVDDCQDMQNLARTMNFHLKSLSTKEYAQNVAGSINEKHKIGNVITLMFLPSEHAVEKIMQADTEFMNKAWQANIFPVGPAGLMNMLSFAKFQISEHLMMQNHQQIIEEVKKLIGSISLMSTHSIKLGKTIAYAVNHYDRFAASFNSNFLSKAKAISKLGIDGSGKKEIKPLERYQLVSYPSEMIEININAPKTQELEN
jgi:DNA recombination protein RmuC